MSQLTVQLPLSVLVPEPAPTALAPTPANATPRPTRPVFSTPLSVAAPAFVPAAFFQPINASAPSAPTPTLESGEVTPVVVPVKQTSLDLSLALPDARNMSLDELSAGLGHDPPLPSPSPGPAAPPVRRPSHSVQTSVATSFGGGDRMLDEEMEASNLSLALARSAPTSPLQERREDDAASSTNPSDDEAVDPVASAFRFPPATSTPPRDSTPLRNAAFAIGQGLSAASFDFLPPPGVPTIALDEPMREPVHQLESPSKRIRLAERVADDSAAETAQFGPMPRLSLHSASDDDDDDMPLGRIALVHRRTASHDEMDESTGSASFEIEPSWQVLEDLLDRKLAALRDDLTGYAALTADIAHVKREAMLDDVVARLEPQATTDAVRNAVELAMDSRRGLDEAMVDELVRRVREGVRAESAATIDAMRTQIDELGGQLAAAQASERKAREDLHERTYEVTRCAAL